MSLKDIKNFVEGNINYFINRSQAPQHIREQILYRMLKCANCALSTQCTICHCATPQLFFAPNKQDSQGPAFFYSQEKWSEMKKTLLTEELLQSSPEVIKKFEELGIF